MQVTSMTNNTLTDYPTKGYTETRKKNKVGEKRDVNEKS